MGPVAPDRPVDHDFSGLPAKSRLQTLNGFAEHIDSHLGRLLHFRVGAARKRCRAEGKPLFGDSNFNRALGRLQNERFELGVLRQHFLVALLQRLQIPKHAAGVGLAPQVDVAAHGGVDHFRCGRQLRRLHSHPGHLLDGGLGQDLGGSFLLALLVQALQGLHEVVDAVNRRPVQFRNVRAIIPRGRGELAFGDLGHPIGDRYGRQLVAVDELGGRDLRILIEQLLQLLPYPVFDVVAHTIILGSAPRVAAPFLQFPR